MREARGSRHRTIGVIGTICSLTLVLSFGSRETFAGAPSAPSSQEVDADGFQFTRTLEPDGPGWWRVEIPPRITGKFSPDGRDIRVLDENGRVVPHTMTSDLFVSTGVPVSVQIIEVEAHDSGWLVTMDSGAGSVVHSGLRFNFEGTMNVPDVRLESSDDRSTWLPLATADLFFLGDSPDLRRREVDYPPIGSRYIRLDWPLSAGFPELESAYFVAGSTIEDLVRSDVRFESWTSEAGRSEYRLFLPGPGVVPLIWVEWDGAGSVGYRLSEPETGHWRPRASGVLVKANEGEGIMLDGQRLSSGPLRLELFSTGEADLEVRGVTAGYEPEWLVFHAESNAPHALAYGAPDLSPPDGATVLVDEQISTLFFNEIGPEVEHARPNIEAALAESGAAMPSEPFSAAWPILAKGAASGDVVRLELPDAVYPESRRPVTDLRLDVDGVQLAFLRGMPPDPALVLERRGLHPEPLPGRPGISRVIVDLPTSLLPLSELELSAEAAPFERSIRAFWIDEREGIGVLADPSLGSRSTGTGGWTCSGRSPIPCRVRIGLQPDRSTRLQIQFSDGDNAPLDAVDVRVWRRRDTLTFVWPDGPAPILRVGADGVREPTYDLRALETAIGALPAEEATLGPREPLTGAPGAVAAAERAEWLPLIALAVAALALLTVLWRMLNTTSPHDSEG